MKILFTLLILLTSLTVVADTNKNRAYFVKKYRARKVFKKALSYSLKKIEDSVEDGKSSIKINYKNGTDCILIAKELEKRDFVVTTKCYKDKGLFADKSFYVKVNIFTVDDRKLASRE